MSRDVLLWCLPYLALLVASLAALRMLAWISGVKMQLRRLAVLHADQRGGEHHHEIPAVVAQVEDEALRRQRGGEPDSRGAKLPGADRRLALPADHGTGSESGNQRMVHGPRTR